MPVKTHVHFSYYMDISARILISFASLDEGCHKNGILNEIIDAFKQCARDPRENAVLLALATKLKQSPPDRNGKEGGYAFWRKDRVRYAIAALLFASMGWFRYAEIGDYIDVLECLRDATIPTDKMAKQVTAFGNDADLDVQLESQAPLSVYKKALRMTDEQFLSADEKEMLTFRYYKVVCHVVDKSK